MERTHLKTHDFTAKDILHLMAERNVILPEKNHSWGKMLVIPKQGESYLSWLMRQAWKFRMTPRKLIQSEIEYWLQKENISLSYPKKGVWAMTLDVLPVSTDWEKVLEQRGLDICVRELQLNISKWFDLTNEPEVTGHNLRNYYHYNLRYCPACWKDKNNRYLRILWRLPFVLFCPEHGIELIEYCHSCGKLLFGDKRYHQASSIVLENSWDDFLIKCRFCNHPLTDEAMEENPKMSGLQNKVLNILLSDSYWATRGRYIVFWLIYQTIIEKRKIDSMEARLKVMETLLEKPPLISYPNCYPQDLLTEIERRFQVASLYLSGTPARDLAKKFYLTEYSIRTFAKDLMNEKSIEEIIKRQFGYKDKVGLELAQAELRAFKSEYGRLPKSYEMMGIRGAISDKEWISFGIRTWNSLLDITLGEINNSWGIYIGEKGLEQAMTELRIFKSKNSRLPKTTDRKMGGIVATINEKEWASFGIEKWNDILKKTFGETNLKMGVYKGEKGLKLAIMELQAFKTNYNRLPKVSDKGIGGIYEAIKRREWTSFGVSSWNGMLMKACGEINAERGIYTDERGLERAMKELRAFKDDHGRFPINKDKKMGGIIAAIRRRAWASIGVLSWNDLLWRTFGSANKNGRTKSN